tara:strand:- start:332 stop:1096 length:765 start_codon:yes stop_codon:yes gene_type:complete
MLNIEIIPCLNDNYSYVLHDEKNNMVAIVDPSDFKTCDKLISQKFKKLDFILNTHHHADHIGGNEKLKDKYKSKILACEIDRNRIPNIDQHLHDGQTVKIGNFSFKVIFIPGHTKGHIAFYFENEKIIFTGDTLFSLGCGRIFEGTPKQMFSSINKIKNLPKDTKIYFGHEYTKSNSNFCFNFDKNNKALQKKISWINTRQKKGLPTSPTILEEELLTNIFLRCENDMIKKSLGMNNKADELVFEKLRNLKDNF